MKKLFITLLFIGWYSSSHTGTEDLLNRAVAQSNSGIVEKLLAAKKFSSKEIKTALKIAEDVIVEKSSQKRTKTELAIMLFGLGFAYGMGMQFVGFGMPEAEANEKAAIWLSQIINLYEPDQAKRAAFLADHTPRIPMYVKRSMVLGAFVSIGLGYLGYKKWRAPYERYDNAVKIGDLLRAALSAA